MDRAAAPNMTKPLGAVMVIAGADGGAKRTDRDRSPGWDISFLSALRLARTLRNSRMCCLRPSFIEHAACGILVDRRATGVSPVLKIFGGIGFPITNE